MREQKPINRYHPQDYYDHSGFLLLLPHARRCEAVQWSRWHVPSQYLCQVSTGVLWERKTTTHLVCLQPKHTRKLALGLLHHDHA
jgi:hypothetical protein